MANGRGKKFKNEGSSHPQSSWRTIDKRAGKENKQKATRIHSSSLLIHTAAPSYAFGPTCPNVPVCASTSTASFNCTDVRGEMLACKDQLSGYIFMCNGKTKTDCYRYRVFGLPAARMEAVEKIKPHMKLFLFDFDSKLLYGIYIAASSGELGIERTAFGGKFLAQVRFEIFKDCLPLPESAFKHVIKDNYNGGFKFRQELNDEQVTNLMAMFRPIALPQPAIAVSLTPNAVLPAKFAPHDVEVQNQPAAELSASYDQYLAPMRHIHPGLAYASQQLQQAGAPFTGISHASSANMTCLQPAVQSKHCLPVVAERQCDPYYPAEAHPIYFPALPQHDPSSRGNVLQLGTTIDYYNHSRAAVSTSASVQAHALVPSQFSTALHGQVHLPSQTAAYWAPIASEDPKQVCSSYQIMQPMSSGLASKNVPVSSVGATLTYPAVRGNSDRETVLKLGSANDYNHNLAFAAADAPVGHAVVPLQFQATSHGPVHFPSSSSLAAYWTAVASEDPKQVHSEPHQKLPTGGTGVGAGNMPASFSGAASSYTVVPEREQEIALQLNSADSFHHNVAVSAANALLQAHAQVPSHFRTSLHGPAHFPSSSSAYQTGVASLNPNWMYLDPHQTLSSVNGAAYTYNHNLPASANATIQAQAQMVAQIPVQLHGGSYLSSSSQAAAASEDSMQVYSGPLWKLPGRG